LWWDSAEKLNAKGLQLEEEGDRDGAERFYIKARDKNPSWSVPWYNLGLLYKRRRSWPESLRFNRAATELNPEDEAAWWNLGIAATALSDWPTARAAWAGFGINIPEGSGPINLDFGIVPIRLDPDDRGEVVWCERIDPARVIVRSIPLPESGRHFGDTLLHDGEPRGTRILNGKEVPVFDAIQLLKASQLATFSASVQVPAPDDVESLVDLAFNRQLYAEDWSTIRYICKSCSEGSPGEHAYCSEAPWSTERVIAIAAHELSAAERLLAQWSESGDGRSFEEIQCDLPL
jgi:hypothetical protein